MTPLTPRDLREFMRRQSPQMPAAWKVAFARAFMDFPPYNPKELFMEEEKKMAEVTATVQEIVGDPDNDNAKLAVPSSVVGAAADGDPFDGKLIQITPSLSFFVVGADVGGDKSLNVEEVQGDADSDTKWLNGPKTLITWDDGTALSGTTYDTADGPVTVFPVTS